MFRVIDICYQDERLVEKWAFSQLGPFWALLKLYNNVQMGQKHSKGSSVSAVKWIQAGMHARNVRESSTKTEATNQITKTFENWFHVVLL